MIVDYSNRCSVFLEVCNMASQPFKATNSLNGSPRRATRLRQESRSHASEPQPTAMRTATWFVEPNSLCRPATLWRWSWPTPTLSLSPLTEFNRTNRNYATFWLERFQNSEVNQEGINFHRLDDSFFFLFVGFDIVPRTLQSSLGFTTPRPHAAHI